MWKVNSSLGREKISDIFGREKVDRLPAFVSGPDLLCQQLLGVPKLTCGSGKIQAEAINYTLLEWSLLAEVEGMCADTTASNSGWKNRACAFLHQMLEKDLLFYACRLHVYELVFGATFK